MLRNLSILFFSLLFSCSKELPVLEGVDIEKWKNDKNACLGDRKTMEHSIQSEVSKLKGLAEMDVIQLLGRPDGNELYKRNQKFYIYYISPGPACPASDSAVSKLILRFNAMGYAQLVTVETEAAVANSKTAP